MNQVKYNKYKNSTVKEQSKSNEKQKMDSKQPSNSKEKPFYQYRVENSKQKQSLSNEEQTMSSANQNLRQSSSFFNISIEDLNDKIKDIIAKHGGYIPSETSPINEESLDDNIRDNFRTQSQAVSEFKDNGKKKKIIESQLRKLSSSGQSQNEKQNQNNLKSERKSSSQSSHRGNKINQNQRSFIYEQDQDQSSSSEVNCDATNYSFSEGIPSGMQIQELKNSDENQQKESNQLTNRFSKKQENISKNPSQIGTSRSIRNNNNLQNNENNDINESFGNMDQSYAQNNVNQAKSINQNLKNDGNKPKYSTPLKQNLQNQQGSARDIQEGSGLKPFDYSSSTNNYINNSISSSILESSLKKSQPNSKLSLENSIKNIKIKNLTKYILNNQSNSYNQQRIKLIVKPPLLVSEICRGIVGLFCFTGEINEDETFLTKMNIDWADVQPKFSSPGELMNLICRTKSLIKSGKINERNIRYVSKTLDSIEQLVKMEEESRELDEIQQNHFENQVIMENMVVFVDFLGATCDYFFRTSQSNLPISMDTYLNTNKSKKESTQKQPAQPLTDQRDLLQPSHSIQISSYLEEYKDTKGTFQNTQSSLFPNMSYVMSNKSEQYPNKNDQNTQQNLVGKSYQDKPLQSNNKSNKFINTTPKDKGYQKYFLSNSRNNLKFQPNENESFNSNQEESKMIPNVNNSSNNNGYNPKHQSQNNQYAKCKQNLSLNKTSDTYYGLASPSTQKLNSTFTTNITQSRSQTPTSEALSQQKNMNQSMSKLRGTSQKKGQSNPNSYNGIKPVTKANMLKKPINQENQENNSSMNINRSLSKNRIASAKPFKENTSNKNDSSQVPSGQDFSKNRLEKIMELKVKKPKVESYIKRMIQGDPICHDILLKKQRPQSRERSNQNSRVNSSQFLNNYHQMCDSYEHQKSHLSEKLNEVQNQVISLSQRANKVEWDDKRYAKQTQIQEENNYQKYDLTFKREENQRLKEFQRNVDEEEKQMLKEQSENTFLMNRTRREQEKSLQIQNNAEEEFKSYIDLKYKQAMQRRQLMQQKSDFEIKKQEYDDIRNYKSHQKSYDILEQKSRYGDEEVNRLNYSIQKSVERKNELEKRLEKTLDVIYNFRKLTSFKNIHDCQ